MARRRPQFACIPVPRTLTTDADGRMVTGCAVGYLNTRRGNRAFVRDLLADRQPVLHLAADHHTTAGGHPMTEQAQNHLARTAIIDAYSAVEHALVLVDAACNSGTADDVDGYPDDAQYGLKRALRLIRVAERVFTPSAEDA